MNVVGYKADYTIIELEANTGFYMNVVGYKGVAYEGLPATLTVLYERSGI